MAELTRDETRYYHLSDVEEYPLAAGVVVYEGAAVGENGLGYARPLVAGDQFLGFASKRAANVAGVAGAERVPVKTNGLVKLLVAGVTVAANKGADVYATNDGTFTVSAYGNSKIGKVHKVELDGYALVRIDVASKSSETQPLAWATKPTAAAFGRGQAWFSDIRAMGYSDGVSWKLGAGQNIISNPVQEPKTAPTCTDSGIAGVLNGTYSYMCTFVTEDGETEGRALSSNISVTNKKVNLTAIPVSSDSRVIARNIYRNPTAGADVVPMKFVAQIADNTTTTYVDNIADASLGALVNRINNTGGQIYRNDELIFSADTTNTSIGFESAYQSSGYASTAVGVRTMPGNIGLRNNAFGMFANYSLTDGYNNNAFGVHALQNNISGTDNVAFGMQTLYNTTSSKNLAIGSVAGYNNTTGIGGIFIGFQAGFSFSTDNYNTVIGFESLKLNTSGNANTMIGKHAGTYLANGSTFSATLSQCTFLGANTRAKNVNDVGAIVIGYGAISEGANMVVLGPTTITKTFLRGDINLNKTVTAAGTTGAQTINNATGAVNFAAAATSLVVTNSLVTANSIIQLTVGTNDATMKSAVAVAASGSFTIYPNANPTAETRVNFTITN